MNPYAIVAVVAIAILAVVEIFISVQKFQMKKQFLDALEEQDKEKRESSNTETGDSQKK